MFIKNLFVHSFGVKVVFWRDLSKTQLNEGHSLKYEGLMAVYGVRGGSNQGARTPFSSSDLVADPIFV